ncbi:hypothetical protein BD310DRAFT_354772 [Dichomitus squalens]|uniref:F-box domain-containing protein n=1 Tax=Dichomitus squalens TaxID=114155 RepID=A0A4V2K8H6_9APHY|nr:hypothetical protein BD310DRAFT_354772 [Dichomitus squalens]
MSRCKLPVERCEQIVDLCNFPHREFVNKPATRRPSTYATLRACALTCKAWYPRSRLNLLRIVELSTERQVDLLIRTLTAQPFLADLVIELEHYRPPGSLNNYVPLSRSPLPQILQNCRSLVFPLLKSHHITYTRSLPFFAHITRLEIAIDGHTISTLLHLIWSFPDIQHLLLKWSYSREYSTAVSEIYRRKLGEMRPPSCCKYLEYLNACSLRQSLGTLSPILRFRVKSTIAIPRLTAGHL